MDQSIYCDDKLIVIAVSYIFRIRLIFSDEIAD